MTKNGAPASERDAWQKLGSGKEYKKEPYAGTFIELQKIVPQFRNKQYCNLERSE